MITNYLPDLIHCLRPDNYDLDEDTSEHSPLNLDLEMNRFNTDDESL